MVAAAFVVWANMHGAVAIGVASVAAAFVAAWIRNRIFPRALAVTLVLCFLATCISPLGFKLWTFIPESMARSHADQLIEWLPPGFSPTTWPFWAVAAALLVVLPFRLKAIDDRTACLVAIALVMLALAVRASRNVPVFLLVGIPAVSALMAEPDDPRCPPARAANICD